MKIFKIKPEHQRLVNSLGPPIASDWAFNNAVSITYCLTDMSFFSPCMNSGDSTSLTCVVAWNQQGKYMKMSDETWLACGA